MQAVCTRFPDSQSPAREAGSHPIPCGDSGEQGRELHPPVSVTRRVRHCRLFIGEQLRQNFFRAQMVRLALLQLFFRFHA